jgi:hypothetical protein
MIAANPHFMQSERAPYQLCTLLRSLPAALDLATEPITEEQQDQMLAADQHAANFTSTVLHGLEALGRTLRSAATNPRTPVSLDDAAQVGALISELAIQLQFLDDFRTAVADRNLHTAFKAGQK